MESPTDSQRFRCTFKSWQVCCHRMISVWNSCGCKPQRWEKHQHSNHPCLSRVFHFLEPQTYCITSSHQGHVYHVDNSTEIKTIYVASLILQVCLNYICDNLVEVIETEGYKYLSATRPELKDDIIKSVAEANVMRNTSSSITHEHLEEAGDGADPDVAPN